MRNPVRSRFESSRAPSPQRKELPGAGNSGSANTHPNSREGTHVEVTPNEVDVVLQHVRTKATEQVSGGITFLGHNILDVDGAERDRRGAGKGRASQESTYHEYNHALTCPCWMKLPEWQRLQGWAQECPC